MPFNQQMSFPAELTLRTTPDGVRMCKWPVKEIASLVTGERTLWGAEAKNAIEGELLDIEATFDVGEAKAVGFDVRGLKVRWTAGKLTAGSTTAEMKEEGGKVRLRLLVDRSSVEVFGNGGVVTVSSCFIPRAEPVRVVTDGEVKGLEVKVGQLKSAWK
jgi:sucrose-6-phosphate hydrolase SacC (GH32 family)